MSWTSKVIWSEGMFLRPQHFQQNDRYLEAHIEERTAPLRPYSWGLRELDISEDALKMGKIEVNACRGVLPDGTTVNIPKGDAPPVSIEIDSHTKDQTVYLCILEKRPNATDASRAEDIESATRFQVAVEEVRDTSIETDTTAPLELGNKLRQRLNRNVHHLLTLECACTLTQRAPGPERSGFLRRAQESCRRPCRPKLRSSHHPGASSTSPARR